MLLLVLLALLRILWRGRDPRILETPTLDQLPQRLLLVRKKWSRSIRQLIHHASRIFSLELSQEYANTKADIDSTEILHFRFQAATETPSTVFTLLHAHIYMHTRVPYWENRYRCHYKRYLHFCWLSSLHWCCPPFSEAKIRKKHTACVNRARSASVNETQKIIEFFRACSKPSYRLPPHDCEQMKNRAL